ncbi:MAG: C45 family peptidase [Methanoregulaceae archaeon]|nr:C45 family peptidase [Methanoregulaceae archaeon]
MKLVSFLLALSILISTASAFTIPWAGPVTSPAATGLVPVASFEGGHRFSAGDYPVVVLSGTYREMGRQYGALMKTELNDEYRFILEGLAKRGYTKEDIRSMGREAAVLYPERQMEIFSGMAETSGLTVDDFLVLYNGPALYLTLPRVSASCSYLAAWGDYTKDGSAVVSRNWDLGDVMLPFVPWHVLVVYRPSDGSNGVATFGPAGTRHETLVNSKGLFIADDNAGFLEEAPDIRPDIVSEFFRLMLDYSDLDGLTTGLRGTRPNLAWIVDVAGPDNAYVYEVTTTEMKPRTGDGVVAAANHFVNESWNMTTPLPDHSVSRYENLLSQAGEAKGSIDAAKMMAIRDVPWENGGATFVHSVLSPDYPDERFSTIHQVVFAPKLMTLSLKVPGRNWQEIRLGSLFGDMSAGRPLCFPGLFK